MKTTPPKRQIVLEFRQAELPDDVEPPDEPEKGKFRSSLSAVEFLDGGRTIFLGGDETVETTPTLEQLVGNAAEADGFSGHDSHAVSDFLALPQPEKKKGRVGEIDIEGLSADGGYLWVVGSHSLKREKPKKKLPAKENMARLAEVGVEKNRYFLGRVPIVAGADGVSSLARTGAAGETARRVKGKGADGDLADAVRGDPHLGPFLQEFTGELNGESFVVPGIPGKDNGFDIEGLAVKDGRIFIGLRGPVLRGWSLVLEVAVEEKADPGELRLRPIGEDGRLYRKHFLELDGLGLRDLCWLGGDLLLLAGPTMTAEGWAAVFRWEDALTATAEGDTFTFQKDGKLQRKLDLPAGVGGGDNPEGLAVLPGDPPTQIMIVYDAPGPAHRTLDFSAKADVFDIPA